ncbi:MAG: DNA gyrase subunit A [Eubacteriales bacterium]|nr:DNA gyrase subunit A [Eubacteriales bacterium]
MEPNTFDKIKEVDLKNTMESSYIDYAMSVIVSRALPDVRDGLKPVQRRILYACLKMGATNDKKTKKCATIVGETMGHYHPHGDSSIYGALVYMGQPWSMRNVLIDKQGNFGSEDGDSPAAYRYTEGKLSKLAMDMLEDINKDTVDFTPNFSNEQGYDEPTVLPAKFPNLLVNGTTGIAVGMATNIPPHNLREVISAARLMIENRITEGRDTEIDELLRVIKGPDFPTGAEILGTRGIEETYRTGRGKIRMRAICEIETMPNGKGVIKVKELPYLVYRSKVIENIAELVKEKKIDGITGIFDTVGKNSDAKIRIELRKDVNPQVILNQLYKHTQLQDTFGAIMLCIVNGEPKVLNLKQMLTEYLKHQENIFTRRTRFNLKKAEDRAHILEGYLKALDYIDEIVSIIRGSADEKEAKANLIARFEFSDVQAQSIVDMRLKALSGLERKKIEDEYSELQKKIANFREILADENKLLRLISDEIGEIADRYGDDRRTAICFDPEEIDMEDLISDDRVIITRTKLGYVKRMPADTFRAQNRGGKGIKGGQIIENDVVEEIFPATNHEYIMFFTNRGRVFRIKAYEIPEAGRTARGTAVVNLLQLEGEEYITAVIPIREYREGEYILMATKGGMIKKTPLMDYANVRKNGLIAMSLKEGDEVIEVKFTKGNEEILMVSNYGMAVRFNETDVRVTGRNSMGVTGMKFKQEGAEVISMQVIRTGSSEAPVDENTVPLTDGTEIDDENLDIEEDIDDTEVVTEIVSSPIKLLTVSENGYGKRTEVCEFTGHHRGTKGMTCYKIADKTGKLVAAKLVSDTEDILMMTDKGQTIRVAVSNISTIGRVTSGVRIMNVDPDEHVVAVAEIKADENDDAENAENTDAVESVENAEASVTEKVTEGAETTTASASEDYSEILEAAAKDIAAQEEEKE